MTLNKPEWPQMSRKQPKSAQTFLNLYHACKVRNICYKFQSSVKKMPKIIKNFVLANSRKVFERHPMTSHNLHPKF